MIAFTEDGHKYESINPEDSGIQWISATKFASMFHNEFDQVLAAAKASQNKKSKWYGVDPEEMVRIWEAESRRSTDTGSLYHAEIERKYLAMKTMNVFGQDLPVYHPVYDDRGRKMAPPQNFPFGAHPEAMMWHRLTDTLGICGQSDVVAITLENESPDICNNVANIADHKSNKEMKMTGFYDKYTGTTEKMHWPFQYMDDCDFSKYTIQMNFYLYIILKNNPTYKSGKLVLRHVEFEQIGQNEWGYPIHRFVDGLPVVTKITKYPVDVIPMKTMDKAINVLKEFHESKAKV